MFKFKKGHQFESESLLVKVSVSWPVVNNIQSYNLPNDKSLEEWWWINGKSNSELGSVVQYLLVIYFLKRSTDVKEPFINFKFVD